MSLQKPTSPRSLPYSLRIGLALFSAILILSTFSYAINGLSMRFSGDDFCYAAVYRLHGFWGTQTYAYLQVSGYNGNRYALNLASAAADAVGAAFSGFLPLLAILGMVVGLFWIFQGISNLVNEAKAHGSDWLWRYIAAGLVVFFTLRLAPNLGQVLFWRTGMLTYLAPVIACVLLTGFVLSQAKKNGNLVVSLIICLLGSFMAGGFSETSTAVQGTSWVLGFAGALYLSTRGLAWARRLVPLLGTCAVGALLAVLVLYFSPINAARLSNLPAHPGFFETLAISLQSTWIFLYISIKVEWLPNLLLILAFAGFSAISSYHDYAQSTLLRWKRSLVLAALAGAACLILVFCAMIPFAYVQHGYPDARALVIPRFILVLGAAFLGWLLGQAIAQFFLWRTRFQPAWKQVLFSTIVLVLLGLGSVYPLLSARDQASQAWRYQKWARFWESRDQVIHQALLEQRSLVKVVKMDHIIPDVAELSDDPTFWINGCAAAYYGVTSISASLPGWDQAGP